MANDTLCNRGQVRHERTPKSIASLSLHQSRTTLPSTEIADWLQHSGMSSGDPNSNQNDPTFSGTSFSQAIRNLNLSSNQTPTTYGPLHNASASSSSSSSSSSLISSLYQPRSGSEYGALTPLPQIQPPPQLAPGLETYQYYAKISQRLQHSIIKDWVPHVMSAEDIAEYRLATRRRLERIHVLEAEQTRIAPFRDAHIEQALFMARLDYRTRFCRIFRLNDLPNEILTNIFRLVCWSAGNPDINVRWRLNITSVCRHWRHVALDDHTIWNAIWCKDTPNFERSLAWLDRSGDSPIDIRINDSASNPWTLALTKFLVDKLFIKLSNIRVMIIVLHDWDPILYILNSLRRVAAENIPMVMERLEIHRSGPAYIQMGQGYEPSVYRTPVPLFGGATVNSFRNLSMNGVHLDWTHSSLGGLTTLDIRRIPLERAPNIHEFRAILQNSPHINKLVLDGAGPKWPTQPISMLKPILMPELKTLVLGDFSLPYGAYLLSQLACPNVNDLTLMNLLGEDYSPFYSAMTGKVPNVRSLTMYGAELTNSHPRAKAAVVGWLKAMPKVGFMRIKNLSPPFLQLFLYDTEKMQCTEGWTEKCEHPVVPELKFLEYHALDAELIKQWGVGRRNMGVGLLKLYIGATTMERVTKDDAEKLKEAVRGTGVVVIMNHPGKPLEEIELTK